MVFILGYDTAPPAGVTLSPATERGRPAISVDPAFWPDNPDIVAVYYSAPGTILPVLSDVTLDRALRSGEDTFLPLVDDYFLQPRTEAWFSFQTASDRWGAWVYQYTLPVICEPGDPDRYCTSYIVATHLTACAERPAG